MHGGARPFGLVDCGCLALSNVFVCVHVVQYSNDRWASARRYQGLEPWRFAASVHRKIQALLLRWLLMLRRRLRRLRRLLLLLQPLQGGRGGGGGALVGAGGQRRGVGRDVQRRVGLGRALDLKFELAHRHIRVQLRLREQQ